MRLDTQTLEHLIQERNHLRQLVDKNQAQKRAAQRKELEEISEYFNQFIPVVKEFITFCNEHDITVSETIVTDDMPIHIAIQNDKFSADAVKNCKYERLKQINCLPVFLQEATKISTNLFTCDMQTTEKHVSVESLVSASGEIKPWVRDYYHTLQNIAEATEQSVKQSLERQIQQLEEELE